jgi:hypothetical protein
MSEVEKETERWIKFEDFLESINNPAEEGWITIWKNLDDEENKQISSKIFSTFIKKEFKEKSQEKSEWDFFMSDLHYPKEIEPILFFRDFYGIKPHFFDISEKFRHHFNLYQKEDKNYYFLDSSGDENKVIEYNEKEIKVNIKFLFEYLKENELILSMGFDLGRLNNKEKEEYDFEISSLQKNGEDIIFSFGAINDACISKESKSLSFIRGKKYVACPKGFNESVLEPKEEYEEFIVEINDDGSHKYFICDESKLENLFLKPVFFKKEVLDKYYSKPSKYTVHDGYLSCAGLWGIRIDNNIQENVAVFLGDLGRLPNKEQKHWKLYNIPKGKISEPFFKRNFEAEFCSPSNPVDYFKEKMAFFKRKWKDKFGWDLFKDLKKEDEYYWKTLRIPREQKEFDEMVGALTKILIESINSERIKLEKITLEKEKNTGGIYHLEEYLKQKHSLFSPEMFKFIRKLQKLRSKSIHLKNKEYNKIYSYFDKGSFSKTFEKILLGAITTLNTIENKIFK